MTNKSKPSYVKAYGPWSVILLADPLAIPLARVLAMLRVHPNAITAASLVAGLATGVFFALGHWLWGAAAFYLSHFFDCIDGNVARCRKMTSELGAKLDAIADGTRKPSSFMGIGIYFYMNAQMQLAILTIAALVVHVAVHKLYLLIGVLEYDLEFPNFHRKVVRLVAPRLVALYTFFEEQLIEFCVFPVIAVIVGLPEGAVWFLYGAGVVTMLSLGKLCILWNHRLKGRYEQVRQDWTATKGNLDKATEDHL
ncbi:MAG: CDP-alcohol phosphatidyltransferase family protein [Phycisphaerales bacterium]|nr:MAG: CDP-alcohol phosphatidyltransferase family protein [Phycisphaerales bacterium]